MDANTTWLDNMQFVIIQLIFHIKSYFHYEVIVLVTHQFQMYTLYRVIWH